MDRLPPQTAPESLEFYPSPEDWAVLAEVTGSIFPVTLGLIGSGFTWASAVLVTNLTIATGASYLPTIIGDTNISATRTR